jgi:hypothetical protein
MEPTTPCFSRLSQRLRIQFACFLLFSVAILFFSRSVRCQGLLTITFDGSPEQPPGTAYTVTDYTELGMSFTPVPESFGFGRVGPSTLGFADNGTVHLKAAFGDSLMFSSTSSLLFVLVSVDLGEYSTVVPDPVTVQFVGYRHDGSMVTTDFMTDGVIDGTGPLADFETFYFDTKEWSGLDRVEIPTYGWSLDNLVVSVPEPSSILLALAGGLLLWMRRSRV